MKFNILIVDDEENIREILISLVKMIFLKNYPFLELHISDATNGSKAFAIAQSQNQDIILTDITMPIMDGYEFIRKVRLFDKTVPILVLSALSNSKDVDKIMQSGASNYTSKPLNGKLFTAQIKIFVDFYLRRQNKYNHSAINLYTKNIFKRKTEFLIEKEDDLIEFWEYLVAGIFEKYRIETVLQFIYDAELIMIKKSISNSIILEESNENFYLTLSEMNKLPEDSKLQVSKNHPLDEKHCQSNGFFISLVIDKKEDELKSKIIINQNNKSSIENTPSQEKEARLNDIRYSVHEKVSPEEFLLELDPTFEDKIESFLDDLSEMSICIYNLEGADLKEAKNNINRIITYINNFNTIIETLGLFNIINRSFSNLIIFLTSIDDETLTNGEKRILLSKMLQGLADDLNNWISTMFFARNATDIHYLDASFSDNCFAIESAFKETEAKDDDEDSLEFF